MGAAREEGLATLRPESAWNRGILTRRRATRTPTRTTRVPAGARRTVGLHKALYEGARVLEEAAQAATLSRSLPGCPRVPLPDPIRPLTSHRQAIGVPGPGRAGRRVRKFIYNSKRHDGGAVAMAVARVASNAPSSFRGRLPLALRPGPVLCVVQYCRA